MHSLVASLAAARHPSGHTAVVVKVAKSGRSQRQPFCDAHIDCARFIEFRHETVSHPWADNYQFGGHNHAGDAHGMQLLSLPKNFTLLEIA